MEIVVYCYYYYYCWPCFCHYWIVIIGMILEADESTFHYYCIIQACYIVIVIVLPLLLYCVKPCIIVDGIVIICCYLFRELLLPYPMLLLLVLIRTHLLHLLHYCWLLRYRYIIVLIARICYGIVMVLLLLYIYYTNYYWRDTICCYCCNCCDDLIIVVVYYWKQYYTLLFYCFREVTVLFIVSTLPWWLCRVNDIIVLNMKLLLKCCIDTLPIIVIYSIIQYTNWPLLWYYSITNITLLLVFIDFYHYGIIIVVLEIIIGIELPCM